MLELLKHISNNENNIFIVFLGYVDRLAVTDDRHFDYFDFVLQQSYLDKINKVNHEYSKINEFITYA